MNAREEVRVTSPTGGQKGRKIHRYGLIPAVPLHDLAELCGKGAEKYSADNWRRGFDWSLSFDAMMRHAWAFWRGEDYDPETGVPHVISAAWHCLVLAEFMRMHRGFDDRPIGPAEPA